MHDTAQEAELLGRVSPILADVILGSSRVRADPLIEIRRPRENVGRMPLLRNFHHGGVLQLEDVLVPEEKLLAGTLPELVVIERIVVRLPRYLGDVEIRRDPEFAADASQFRPLEWFTLQPEANLLDRVEEFAESMVRLAGIRQNFLRVTGQSDPEATRKSRLPVHQAPLTVSKSILSAPNKGRIDAELRADQVPPLVPCRVKRKRKRDRVQYHFRFTPAVMIDGMAIEELDFPERSTESPLPTIR